jgi:hypothetical protein
VTILQCTGNTAGVNKKRKHIRHLLLEAWNRLQAVPMTGTVAFNLESNHK